ncbi:MAG: radical SAM family heme chaperone HemW [Ruminococcaceae bacterium]|nr:radical SAM family heme chaperone HemW [Oscillospiraceae bacterium]
MMKNKKSLGIYLHIPFCIQKCAYCDFCSFPNTSAELREKYVDALCRDIEERARLCRDRICDTVYFGGGTPTLLTVLQFERIFSALRENFDISPDAEITVECNPKTADLGYFCDLRRLGVNRLSIGMQSAHDRELEALGRVHRSEDFFRAFADARRAGFDNISVDLMFGIPYQTEKSFKKTLEIVTELEPEHISAYGLIIEEGTPFFANREKLVLPGEDREYTMYTEAVGFLAHRGYKRYEISNFSKPERESRHNLKYWQRDEYVGLGVSAHSFLCEKRSFAPADINAYMRGQFEKGCEEISENDAMSEYVMLAMRTVRGVDLNVFYDRFGKDFDEMFADKLKPYRDGEFVVRKDGSCAFTDSGFYVSNEILSEILDFDQTY